MYWKKRKVHCEVRRSSMGQNLNAIWSIILGQNLNAIWSSILGRKEDMGMLQS